MKKLQNIKIKDDLQIPSFKIKYSYVLLIVGVLVLGYLLVSWSKASKIRLKEQNKFFLQTEERLMDEIDQMKEQRKADSLLIESKLLTIDSLESSALKHVKTINYLSREYEKYKNDYNSASTSDKWSIFTDLIDNK